MDYDTYFTSALNRLRDERRYRVFADLERIAGRFPYAVCHSSAGRREVVIWCSNDYLGMGQHPKVIGAMVEAAVRFGVGAGGTRNIAGTSHPLLELERELSDLHRKQAALVFTSGYVSNLTGIATLAKLIPDCTILSDEHNHNSIIEGVRRSGCEKLIWRHNDIGHLERLLQQAGRYRPKPAGGGGIGWTARVPRGTSRMLPGLGIALPIFVPAIATAIVALILSRQYAAPLAYVGGSLGTLIGADTALPPFSQNSKDDVCFGSGQAQPGQSKPSGWFMRLSVAAPFSATPCSTRCSPKA